MTPLDEDLHAAIEHVRSHTEADLSLMKRIFGIGITVALAAASGA